MNSIRITAFLLLTICQVAQAQQDVFFIFTSDRPDSINLKFHRDYVFDESSFEDGFKKAYISTKAEVLRYPNVSTIARLSLSSYSWSGIFIGTHWIVEPGDSVHIQINFNQNPSTITFSGCGAVKYQLAFDTRKLIDGIRDAEYEVYDKVKTHAEAYKSVADLESTLAAKLKIGEKQLSSKAYNIWLVDVQAIADLARLHILSHQWTVNPESRQDILQELNKKPAKVLSYIWYSSRSLIQYRTELIKWKLLHERYPDYKHYDLGYIQKYNVKDLFMEFKKFPPELQQVFMVYTLVNYSALAFAFGETHPNLVAECIQMAENVTTNTNLKNLLNSLSRKIKPGIHIEDLVTLTEADDTLKLSDFRGKKVILDLWGPRCSGCKDFRNDLVEHILPKLKDRNDIVIWSVGGTSDKELWKSYLPTYCHPDFTASWLNKPNSGSEWEMRYNASYAPFIMLIDEQGKLISSTVRNPKTILSLMDEPQ